MGFSVIYSHINQTWPLLDNVQKIFTIIGFLIAGIWTYFNFFKGRTYWSRLQVGISGVIVPKSDSVILLATIQLKNVGLSRVAIEQRGSALSVFSDDSDRDFPSIATIPLKRLAVFPVFEKHSWIGPAETIEDQRAILIAKPESLMFQLEARIISRNTAWNARTIIIANGQREEPANGAAAKSAAAKSAAAATAAEPRRDERHRKGESSASIFGTKQIKIDQ